MKKIGFFMKSLVAMMMCAVMFTAVSCSDDDDDSDPIGILEFSIEGFGQEFQIAGGVITNKDALPYKTDPTTLKVNIKTVAGTSVFLGEKKIANGDVVDFSKDVVLKTVGANASDVKNYTVKVNISNVDPRTLVWNQTAVNKFEAGYNTNTAYAFDGKLWVLLGKTEGEEATAKLYSSVDGETWKEETMKGEDMPLGEFHNMIEFNNKLYSLASVQILTDWGFPMKNVRKDLYVSEDGINWTLTTDPFGGKSRLLSSNFVVGDKIYSVGGNDTAYGNIYGADAGNILGTPAGLNKSVAISEDGQSWDVSSEVLTEEMPMRMFNASYTVGNTMYIAGGLSQAGEALADVWSSTDGVNWTKVSEGAFDARIKMQVVSYEDKLYMIGGQLADGTCTKEVLVSEDNGANWEVAPLGYQLLDGFTARAGHSAFVKDGKVYVIGGFSTEVKKLPAEEGKEDKYKVEYTFVNDVWVGDFSKIK